MARGGKRPGSGRPKGYKSPKTIEKEAARELTRQIITRSLEPMIQAQIANAIGIGHLYTRDKSGKFTKITTQAGVDELLAKGREGENYWIFIKDPSTQAFTDLVNRAIDKPKEQVQEIQTVGVDERIARLERARARL
jgi:hypothetical protein